MLMKLVVAIVQNEVADGLIEALTEAHYGATRLASTGGFLRQGNTTIIVGVPDEAVQNVIDIVVNEGRGRRGGVTMPFPDGGATVAAGGSGSGEATNSSATVFVLDLDRYERV